jgi:hypothetical protein
VQRLLAPQSFRRALEELERVAVAAADRRDVELLLRSEEPEEIRLRDAGPLRDVLGRGALEAAVGELDQGGVENIVTAFEAAERGGSRSCGHSK